MELALKLVLWIHFLSLALGGVATFGIPALMSVGATLEPAQRPVMGKAIMRLAALGRMALTLLVLSGIFLLALGFQGGAGLSHWFWLKMLLVLALIGLVIYNIGNGKRILAGDAASLARAPLLAKVGIAILALIVLAAVLTFG